ncbi:MAG TPA: metallophosphoesterase family protein [Candidatus Cryosericum sp.]|nr:metallophosphoesterase family protein [Candidatus Cryosericum sp.]
MPAFSSASAEEAAATDLRFGSDGTFTILIFSDLQDIQFVTRQIIAGETSVLKDTSADLIVLLGDQMDGANPIMHIGNGKQNCLKTLKALLEPIAESGIPFAVVFGNHDYDAPISIADQVKFYESYDTCLGVNYGTGLSDTGAYSLPVYMTDGSAKAMELYFFDSGCYLPNGDYDTVSAEQVAWYNEQSILTHNENDNQALPSMAFFHIPLPEVYDMLTEVEKDTPNSFEGVGVGAGKYYLPDSDMIFTGDVNEPPCPSSSNNGLFDAFMDNGDVFLAVNGHDHTNSYIGSLHGIDLANAPGSSYTSYGDEDTRGVRLFRFTEHNVKNYETLHVRFGEYNTPASFGLVRYFFTTTIGLKGLPSMAKMAVSVLVLLIAAIVVLIVLLKKRGKKSKLAAQAKAAEQKPEEPSNK